MSATGSAPGASIPAGRRASAAPASRHFLVCNFFLPLGKGELFLLWLLLALLEGTCTNAGADSISMYYFQEQTPSSLCSLARRIVSPACFLE